MAKSVSLIIVSRDLREYLTKCLIAIENNTDPGLVEEIIVVDNGSIEMLDRETLACLTSFALTIIRLDKNASFAFASNRGVESSSGDYICFMNNDVEVLPRWLPYLYEVLEDNPQVGVTGPKMIFPDGSIQFAGYAKDPVTGFQKHKYRDVPTTHTIPEANVAGPVSSLTGACLLMRREDAHFDERYWYGCEDIDLCMALKRKDKIIFYQPKSVIIHHEEVSRSSGMVTIDYKRNRSLFKKKWGRCWEQLLWQIVT